MRTRIKKAFRSEKGFTLIELVVVIGIIGLLAGIAVINAQKSDNSFVLAGEAQNLAQEIRRVQEMAISSREHGPSAIVPKGGYGVFIASTGITLFADCDDNGLVGTTTECGTYSEIVKEFTLDPKVTSLAISVDGVSKSSVTVLYKPPLPVVKIFGDSVPTNGNESTINLLDAAGRTKTITVNRSGLVSVK